MPTSWGSRAFNNGSQCKVEGAALSATAPVSFGGWYYTRGANGQAGGNAYQLLTGYSGSGMYTDGQNVSPVNLSIFTGGGSKDPLTITVSVNTWMHVLNTWDGTTVRVYVNGVLSDSYADATGYSAGGLFSVGDQGTSLQQLNGFAADVACWSATLTLLEIASLAKGTRPSHIRPATLLTWFPLDGLNSPEADLSGFAHNGTVTGATSGFGPPIGPITTTSKTSFISDLVSGASMVFNAQELFIPLQTTANINLGVHS